MRLNIDFVIRATGATLPAGQLAGIPTNYSELPPFTQVSIDSRTCIPGSLFLCLQGEHVDGHDYAAQAVQNGCTAILAARDPFNGTASVPVLLVPDVLPGVEHALRRLATAWRQIFARRSGQRSFLVGLTGTAGKTTVKDMLSTVMEQAGPVCRTMGNFNNNLGLPLSILNADLDATCWVLEAGINQAGEMDQLGEVLRPDLALILNAGAGHIAGLGKKGTAHHKATLLKYLQPDGIGLISADYPDLVRESRAVRPDLVFFSSTGRQVVYRAAYVGPSAEGRGLYRLWLDGETVDAETPFNGAFGAENVIAVAAAAHKLGLDARQIATGLSMVSLPKQRFSRSRVGAWTIIDDSYNANPLSAARVLEAAAELAGDDPFVCVLGEMRELGHIAEEEHEKLGRLAAENKTRAVFWTGDHFEAVSTGLRHAGFTGRVETVNPECPESLFSALKEMGITGGTILFKGSRANRLERLVPPFTAYASGKKQNHAEQGHVL